MNSTIFNCPSCSQPLTLPPTFAGPQVQCPNCQTVIPIPNAPQAMAPTPMAVQPLAPAAAVSAVSIAPPAAVMDEHIEKSIGKMSIETTAHTGAMTPARELFLRLTAQVSKIFVGQDELVLGTLVSLFSRGHVLIESVPGLGKTLFVRVLGHALGCDFGRIQFTADLMPSDVTGAPVFNMKTQEFKFHPGPVFTQLLLADEINRAPAKTHAALLEIMQEHRVTVDGTSYPIAPPFIVIATQNPVEQEGTYNLPEAQLDRFMMKLIVNYPSSDQEANILKMHSRQESISDRLQTEIETVTTPEEINAAIKTNGEVMIDDALVDYINRIVRLTRSWPQIYMGASPRAGLALMQGARTLAAFQGRDYAIPDDVVQITLPVLRHRVILTAEAEVEGQEVDQILGDMIRTVEVPRI
jgi:MoxR-like ATPase